MKGPVAMLFAMLKITKERRALGALPERLLRDIGVEEGAALGEAGRPFWDVPAGRADLR